MVMYNQIYPQQKLAKPTSLYKEFRKTEEIHQTTNSRFNLYINMHQKDRNSRDILQGQRQHLVWRQVSDVREYFEGANKLSQESNQDQATYLGFHNTRHSSTKGSGVGPTLLSFFEMCVFKQANNFIEMKNINSTFKESLGRSYSMLL